MAADALTQTLWVSGSHNMGMVVDRSWYELVQHNAFNFCYHDDYNWDFSLMAISKNKNWQVFLPQGWFSFSNFIIIYSKLIINSFTY